jgi:hypothetical protein
MGIKALGPYRARIVGAAGLDLPRVWFFGIFSASLLLSGLLGPAAGRVIDRRGGRDVLA